MSALLQARFHTKDDRYKVSDVPFALPTTASSSELNSLIKTLLDQTSNTESPEKTQELSVDFDFLVNGEFLQSSLEVHVEAKGLSTESVLDIEYIVRNASPSLTCTITQDDWISSVACASDRILSGGFDGVANVWDVEGNCLARLSGHDGAVKAVSWISSDKLGPSVVTGSQDQSIRIWKVDYKSGEGECVCLLKGHVQGIESLSVDKTGQRLCSGSWDGTIKLWQTGGEIKSAETEKPKSKRGPKAKKRKTEPHIKDPIGTLSGHKQAVSAVLWLDGESLCSGGWDHCIRVWDLESGVNTSTLTGTSVFRDLDYSPLSQLLASGNSDRYVRLWDHRHGDGSIVKLSLVSHTGWVSSVCWSPLHDHQLVSASYDQTMRLWDIRSPKTPLFLLSGHRKKIFCVDWSESGVIASGGADKKLVVHRQ